MSQSRHEVFQALHQSGCFVVPNPWDAGSARLMAGMGAKALATTSAGFAFTLGRPDMGNVSRDEALAHAEAIVAATPLPVTGDFENGFADDPDGVAETVRLAAEAGLSGCSIEDTDMGVGTPAYDFDLAVERIRAASAAARSLGRPFVLCARADGLMNGTYGMDEGIRRLQAFEAAGADLLYLPVPPDLAALHRIIASVTKPVNALAGGALGRETVATLADAGVRRISVGSRIARATHKVICDAMAEITGGGDFARMPKVATARDIDALLLRGAQG